MPSPWFRALVLVGAVAAISCSKSGKPPGSALSNDASGAREGATLQLLKEPADVPAFNVTDLDGRTVSSSDLRGKVVLVNFWATWCPPCRAEIPDLIKLQDKYRDKLVILGVSEDEEIPPQDVKKFATEQKMNYVVAMSTPELSKIFKGVSALPTTFVIGPDGKIQQRHVGMLNAETAELETRYLSGDTRNVRVERVEDETKALLTKAAQAKEIPGVDLTKLTPAQRTEALKALNAEDCTCGCGLTLAACRINDPECSISLPIAKKIAERIARGEKIEPATTH
jgi:thiol-disulfide isomerase/thioredoxin